jgi:hypothetical protein
MQGQDEKALMEYMAALQENRLLPELLGGFQSLLQKQGIAPADQIELLGGIYSGREDVRFLAESLTPRAGQVWLYYRKKAALPVDGAAAFLLGGHIPAGALEAARQLKACRQVKEWAAG